MEETFELSERWIPVSFLIVKKYMTTNYLRFFVSLLKLCFICTLVLHYKKKETDRIIGKSHANRGLKYSSCKNLPEVQGGSLKLDQLLCLSLSFAKIFQIAIQLCHQYYTDVNYMQKY